MTGQKFSINTEKTEKVVEKANLVTEPEISVKRDSWMAGKLEKDTSHKKLASDNVVNLKNASHDNLSVPELVDFRK